MDVNWMNYNNNYAEIVKINEDFVLQILELNSYEKTKLIVKVKQRSKL